MKMKPVYLASFAVLAFVLPGKADQGALAQRQYVEGEQFDYRMTSSNHKRGRVTGYDVMASVTVVRDDAGRFFEALTWTVPNNDGTDGGKLQQRLSLASDAYLALPDLSQVPVNMIGPVTDLLTIYVDVWLALRQGLARPGDRAVVAHGEPNSWADGTQILFGEDAIDFEIAIRDVDAAHGTATLSVKHVPPADAEIEMPAAWMATPVADVPNNWAQVIAIGNGRYLAATGKETFDVIVELSLADGRILSARLDNAIEVFERICTDAVLVECAEGRRHRIVREVELEAMAAAP